MSRVARDQDSCAVRVWCAYSRTPIIVLAIRQCAAWASTLITHKHPERRKPLKKRKPTHNVQLLFWVYFWLEVYLFRLLSLLLPSHYVLLLSSVESPSGIQAPSPRHWCGSVIPSPPAPFYFLAVVSWSLFIFTVRNENAGLSVDLLLGNFITRV